MAAEFARQGKRDLDSENPGSMEIIEDIRDRELTQVLIRELGCPRAETALAALRAEEDADCAYVYRVGDDWQVWLVDGRRISLKGWVMGEWPNLQYTQHESAQSEPTAGATATGQDCHEGTGVDVLRRWQDRSGRFRKVFHEYS